MHAHVACTHQIHRQVAQIQMSMCTGQDYYRPVKILSESETFAQIVYT